MTGIKVTFHVALNISEGRSEDFSGYWGNGTVPELKKALDEWADKQRRDLQEKTGKGVSVMSKRVEIGNA